MFRFPTVEKNYETLNNENETGSYTPPANEDGVTKKQEEVAAAGPAPVNTISRRGVRPNGRRDDAGEPGTALCPTCDGHGKVPKEKERNLLALIPADDDRLKPSRTKTYVLAAVVVSLIIAGLSIFFIYPRSFEFFTPFPKPELEPTKLYINTTEKVVEFTIRNRWILENNNWYYITLNSLNVRAYLNKLVTETVNQTAVVVPAKGSAVIVQSIGVTFKDDLEYLVKFCNDDRAWVHTIYMRFQATAQVSVMGYAFTKIVESYQRVSCGRPEISTTPAPRSPTKAKS